MQTDIFKIPETAQYYLPLKTDKNVATLFYRWSKVSWNDGTITDVLQYLSSFGVWMNSAENTKNVTEFINNNLIKL